MYTVKPWSMLRHGLVCSWDWEMISIEICLSNFSLSIDHIWLLSRTEGFPYGGCCQYGSYHDFVDGSRVELPSGANRSPALHQDTFGFLAHVFDMLGSRKFWIQRYAYKFRRLLHFYFCAVYLDVFTERPVPPVGKHYTVSFNHIFSTL